TPKDLIFSEENYRQSDVTDSFVNLFGIGDGGGGPSREHIEFGLRSRDCEGVPKLKFEHSYKYFSELEKNDLSELPLWDDELYLEFHRGTYTSQAKLKQLNRQVEILLRDAELLDALVKSDNSQLFEEYWKILMLHQFHDILPGSSINRVNEEAKSALGNLKDDLIALREKLLLESLGTTSKGESSIVLNSLSWPREECVKIAAPSSEKFRFINSAGEELTCVNNGDEMVVKVSVPAMGYQTIRAESFESQKLSELNEIRGSSIVENERIRVILADDGSFSSIYDKTLDRELLLGNANRLQLWEDDPHRWDAWEITSYYRNTTPESAVVEKRMIYASDLYITVIQELKIGNSKIIQTIKLDRDSSMIQIRNKIDWKEEHKMLRVHADVDVKTDFATFEIQYGTLKRSVKNNNSWQQA
ncbi:MAG: hypothetical protein GY786_15370, partial [Proteobacteria bacterium]|nr:hypothetical protein [Pseudomonadota bacterium]